MTTKGPLEGLTVIELAGIGPGPWAGTMLADLGAKVVRIDRPTPAAGDLIPAEADLLNRGRRSVVVDLKQAAGREVASRLVDRADVFLEGFRPGVAERLGLGPEECLDRNPRLVYVRVTGWGQEGPLADTAGHDIDYIAITGALSSIARPGERPVPPVNYLADFGGGGMLAVVGTLAALVERSVSGRGQVVDAAMVDGVAMLQLLTYSLKGVGLWQDEAGVNLLDGGAPFYDTYVCADGRYVAVGALEPQFFAVLIDRLGIEVDPGAQYDPSGWPDLRSAMATAFRTRPRDEWTEVFSGTDGCVAPVLSLTEAPRHPHLAERGTFTEVDGRLQPAPAPRFDRTPAPDPVSPPRRGADTQDVLVEAGFGAEEIDRLRRDRVIG